MRTFKLVRLVDQATKESSGISGTGIVATGLINALGQVVVRWLPNARLSDGSYKKIETRTYYNSLEDVALLHGHGGHTRVRMDDTGIEFSDLDILALMKVA